MFILYIHGIKMSFQIRTEIRIVKKVIDRKNQTIVN